MFCCACFHFIFFPVLWVGRSKSRVFIAFEGSRICFHFIFFSILLLALHRNACEVKCVCKVTRRWGFQKPTLNADNIFLTSYAHLQPQSRNLREALHGEVINWELSWRNTGCMRKPKIKAPLLTSLYFKQINQWGKALKFIYTRSEWDLPDPLIFSLNVRLKLGKRHAAFAVFQNCQCQFRSSPASRWTRASTTE